MAEAKLCFEKYEIYTSDLMIKNHKNNDQIISNDYLLTRVLQVSLGGKAHGFNRGLKAHFQEAIINCKNYGCNHETMFRFLKPQKTVQTSTVPLAGTAPL